LFYRGQNTDNNAFDLWNQKAVLSHLVGGKQQYPLFSAVWVRFKNGFPALNKIVLTLEKCPKNDF
jgi:hypothetical protein